MGNLFVSIDPVIIAVSKVLTLLLDSAGSDQRGDGHASPL